MKAMECPSCSGVLDIFVDVLYPMMAVAVDMLETAVMYQCKSCQERSPDFSNIKCPECFEETLETEVNRKQNPGMNDPTGHIYCRSCDLKLVF
ncbi:MAG: hypothetical protein HeimAB125_13240 [Candidatus Heimdallarchaeota archaeon AB_125]|nr:MAG: hypothetical protein HeimAB125_13240 [Candidatus Heimdallarchaeota archaeon AB_125]